MIKSIAGAVLAGALLLTASPRLVLAQGAQQTLASLDVASVATGYRANKIIGSTVVNEGRETIGKIDDLIIGRNDRALVAVVSVGGFLGVGSKLVAVPYGSLHPTADNGGFTLAGGTKDALKSLPEFQYAR